MNPRLLFLTVLWAGFVSLSAAPADSSSRPDVYRLVGMPETALRWWPELKSVFDLTADQQRAVVEAYDQTVGEAQKVAAAMDQKQAGVTVGRAKKDFASARDSLLTDRQHALIAKIQRALNEVRQKPPEGQTRSKDSKVTFQEILRPLLTPEEVAKLTPAPTP